MIVRHPHIEKILVEVTKLYEEKYNEVITPDEVHEIVSSQFQEITLMMDTKHVEGVRLPFLGKFVNVEKAKKVYKNTGNGKKYRRIIAGNKITPSFKLGAFTNILETD